MVSFKKRIFFLFLGVLLFQITANAQEFSPKFRIYNSAEGLSQSVVLSIFQDSKNFLWFGTEDGLNKFDGYNFKVYRYDPEDSSSISDNWIVRIHLEDSDGNIWLETADRNINIFDPKTDRFKKLSQSENGFPDFRRVFFIKQDNKGLVWISTEKGLFIVEKLSWKVTQIFINNSKDLRIFRSLTTDEQQNAWLASNKGLIIRNSKNNTQSVIEKESDKAIQGIQYHNGIVWVVTENEIIGYNKKLIPQKTIYFKNLLRFDNENSDIAKKRGQFAFVRKDNQNNIWICSQKGLIRFNAVSEEIKIFLNNPSDKSSISSNNIISFYEDKAGNLWFGTTKGLNKYNPYSENFVRISFQPESTSNRLITSVFEDKAGRIWAKDAPEQSEGSHLFYLDNNSMQLIQVKHKISDPEGIPLDLTYDPFIDHNGNLWFGTYGSGVLLYSPGQKKFGIIKHFPDNTQSLAGNSSWGICEDTNGKLWISLFKDGLDCYDPSTGKATHYLAKLKSFTGVKNITILSVVFADNKVWIGTMGHGIISMDINSGQMKHFKNVPGSDKSISSNFILAITKDKSRNLLISYPDAGLDVFNITTSKITNYRKIPGNSNSLFSNSVRYAIATSDGNYWISSDGAITFLNTGNNIMTHYITRKLGGKGILSDKASCIFEDSRGNIWVGTHGGGLALFDKNKKEFKYWNEKNGLINNVIYGILEDSNNKLWISTNKGISRFDPKSSEFVNYFANDGLQSSEFNANSFFKDKKGKMYFGGINGITNFYPANIQTDLVTPDIAITGFQIFNKNVEVIPFNKYHLNSKPASHKLIEDDGHLYLPQNISYTDKLMLDYKYKILTFEFAALRFDMPERCTFMYKMDGFEDDWNIGNRRFATYTNLPPGKYIFKVTAANADGIYNPEPVKIEINIKPPFYLTWWFISFGIAVLIFASTTFVMKREKSLRTTKAILENKVKIRTHELNEKNEELTLRNIQILKQKEEIASQAKRLKFELDNQNQTSEQALLRSQINPHFLFNTLNNIYSLVYQKSTNAPEALMKLSDIMRYMLYDTSSDKVLLDKEIQYLRSFIDLQSLRLKTKDYVLFEVTGDPSGKMIAPMLLIPFVENAFKHGSKSATSPGIVIKLICKPEGIKFSVKNSKNNSAIKDSLGGIGLSNVKRRLQLIYHDRYSLNISEDDVIFDIHLEITEK